jgi:hypothetical protein
MAVTRSLDAAADIWRNASLLGLASAALLGAALAGCMSGGEQASPPAGATAPAVAPVSVTAEELIGNWGLASYREEADIARTEEAARAACGNPYVIGRGASGGVVMHLADQAEPTELALRQISGRTFIGPPNEPAGGPRDREITSFRGDVFETKWTDPSVAERYGVMIFARCGSA